MTKENINEKDDFMDIYDGDDEDTMANKYMTFIAGNESFGIAIEYILEIIELQKITEVPDMPVYVKGVINLRGKIIPVLDLRLRFKMEPREYDDRTCIIVTQINEIAVGLIVDTVSEVVDIEESNIVPSPDFKNIEEKNKYIKGLGKIGEEVKIILDVEKVLFDKELNAINNIKQEDIK